MREDNIGVARALINAGANVNCKDIGGNSALYHSVVNATPESLRICRMLVCVPHSHDHPTRATHSSHPAVVRVTLPNLAPLE